MAKLSLELFSMSETAHRVFQPVIQIMLASSGKIFMSQNNDEHLTMLKVRTLKKCTLKILPNYFHLMKNYIT